MENSQIEWTNHTFNPWWGCMKVSDGCKNCYAQTLDNRYNHADPHWGPNSPRKPMSENYWKQPFIWDKAANSSGVKAKVFCASMADVFEDNDQVIEWRQRLFDVIENTPNLIWQLLTKRPENILNCVPEHWRKAFPENVWMGTSVENQQVYKARVKSLLETPAFIHFLSCEPLLGPLNLKDEYWKELPHIEVDGITPVHKHSYYGIGVDWVIAGGESGPGARPIHPDWARSLRDQCASENIPFFFKQWGEYKPYATKPVGEGIPIDAFKSEMKIYRDGEFFSVPKDMSAASAFKDFICFKVGKANAGALLDGKEYKQFPE